VNESISEEGASDMEKGNQSEMLHDIAGSGKVIRESGQIRNSQVLASSNSRVTVTYYLACG
jgi:hypothetical protein